MQETDLAKRIKKEKTKRGLTNEQLAKLAGLPISNISKLLAGISRYPTVDTVQKIAGALNVSIDYLVNGQEFEPEAKKLGEEYQIVLRRINKADGTTQDVTIDFGNDHSAPAMNE